MKFILKVKPKVLTATGRLIYSRGMGSRQDDIGFLFEYMQDQFAALSEGIGSLAGIPVRLDRMQETIDAILDEQAAVRQVAREHNIQLDNHESRLRTLEA